MNNVNNNFITANYGASQGFDTDDGSSFYNIHDNFFFMADGWKMDYGGHDCKCLCMRAPFNRRILTTYHTNSPLRR